MRFALRRHAYILMLTVGLCVTADSHAQPPSHGPKKSPKAAESETPAIEEAVNRFRVRDFDGALAAFRQAVKEKPDNPPAEVFMADMFNSVNDPAAARGWLERAVFEHHNDPQAYLALGDVNLRERRLVEAFMLFSTGAKRAEAMPDADVRKKRLQEHAYRGLAAVAEARSDWPTAQRYLEAILRAAPKDALISQRLGRAVFFQGKPDDALKHFQTASALDKKRLNPEALLGQLYEQKGDRENAARYMALAVKANPNDLNTCLAVAHWALGAGNLSVAKQQTDISRKINAESLAALAASGTVALYMKDYAQAQRHYEAVVAKAPTDFAATNGLALALCEREEPDNKNRALEYAQSTLRSYPRSTEAAATLGWVLYHLGRLEEADRVFGQVVLAGDLSSSAAYYIARAAVQQGRNEQAKRLLEVALEAKAYFAKRPDAEALLAKLKE